VTVIRWRKSSFSGANDENCVEVAWVKSSFSRSDANCVEIAELPDALGIRDSKNPDGPMLRVTPLAVRTIGALTAG
jgi:Domain of unknown function (DUF397)